MENKAYVDKMLTGIQWVAIPVLNKPHVNYITNTDEFQLSVCKCKWDEARLTTQWGKTILIVNQEAIQQQFGITFSRGISRAGYITNPKSLSMLNLRGMNHLAFTIYSDPRYKILRELAGDAAATKALLDTPDFPTDLLFISNIDFDAQYRYQERFMVIPME